MKLSFVLLLLASSVNANKKKLDAKRRTEPKSPLATRNTAVRACHKIKKGQNEQSQSAMASKKACKCLTGWKKGLNKATGQSECTKVNVKVLRNKNLVSEYATYAEALNRGDADKGKCIVVMGEENVIDCNGVGFDSKKAKKIIAPSNTKVLDWSNNHIKDVHYTWYEGLVGLKKLSFRNNFLRTLDPHTFRGAYHMDEIDLSYNQFAALNNSGLFKKNPNIRVIKLNNNMIGELKMKVISVLNLLERFEVQNNRLKKVTGGILSKATNLAYADFGHNHIEKIATKAFTENINLKELYLNNNKLKAINKKLLSKQENLVHLRLDYNEIETMNKDSMQHLKSAKTILLNNNKLTTLAEKQFKGLKSLEKINLDHNQIASIPASVFNNCDNLKYVFIRYNKITNLDSAMFSFNPLLKIAFVSHNEIDNIEEDLLKDKADLKRLDVGDNELTNLDNILDGSQDKLEYFYMNKNKLERVNQNMIARAPVLRALDSSENNLSDNDLAFVSNNIDVNANLGDMSVDLRENQFENPSLDALFVGASDIARLKTEIENSETL
jgi:Leucine-rich repeat (LRR) protein